MFFTIYEGIQIIYFIDKKIHPGYQKPRIILGRGRFHESLFNDTLLDGEMIKDNNQKWTYLINDMYVYKGSLLINKILPNRLEMIIELFDKHYTSDDPMDVCKFVLKKYAMATQEGSNALIEFSKVIPYTSRGIYYSPFNFKYKPKLLHFDETVIKSVVRKVKDVPDFQETLQNPTSPTSPTSPNKIQLQKSISISSKETSASNTSKTCWLRKTEFPDVYDVFDAIQGNKLSIAAVPNLTTSKMLREVFKNATVVMFFPFICEWNEKTNKWLPLSSIKT